MTDPPNSNPGHRTGLATLMDQAPDLLGMRDEAILSFSRERLASFGKYNDSRLGIALGAFDQAIKLALFELFFLLNTNDPTLKDWKYQTRRFAGEGDSRRPAGAPKTADLYVDGAPAGVKGIREFSPRFRAEYEQHIRQEFHMDPYGNGGEGAEFPIVALQAVGSTGTIGQKPAESDVDMQVIYETSSLVFDSAHWNDAVLSQALNKEYKLWLRLFSQKHNVTPEMLRKPEVRDRLHALATDRLKADYPNLYRALPGKDRAFAEGLVKGGDAAARLAALREMFDLMKRGAKLKGGSRAKAREAQFKRRVQAIQDYVNSKFPEAEIYLFVYTVEHFRSGTYDSTLEFKESSGSAYEFILNYETLMPGIQFSPQVPLHFLLPDRINNDSKLYDAALDCIRFRALPGFPADSGRIVDLGPAMALDVTYVARHGGAIYWEAFKASSGNLAKAMLNLLRFETLLDKRHLHTIIHVIKEPALMDGLCAPKPADEKLLLRYDIQLGQRRTGLAGWAVVDIESRFPELRQDPWWLRYRALKVAFEEPNGILGIEPDERQRLSAAIDLCFCLHLRISDVLRITEEGRKPVSYRDKVLHALLDAAFPAETSRRIHLNNLLTGDVRGLIDFERDMRDLFQRSMMRVEQKMAKHNVRQHVGKKEELDLWLNYYMENFQPQPHVVPRMIMKHLKSPRVGLHVEFRAVEGWTFQSLQRLGQVSLLQRHAEKLRYLPDRITLFESKSFMIGLAHCILNGYVGRYVDKEGQQRRTVFDVEKVKVRQAEDLDDKLATLTAEQMDRLAQGIASFFPYQYVDYKAILKPERKITGVFVAVNPFYFGRVSVIYRNNVNTWFCEETDLPAMRDHAVELAEYMEGMVKFEPLHRHLGLFFTSHLIDPRTARIGGWINPNSFTAGVGVDRPAVLRGMEDGSLLVEGILRAMGVSPPPEFKTA